ncbi:hypothetical protein CC78DRAFT_597171 [Lojkania enalia]|uniref:Uncharacterized protein n=1 Tax=Lojkania enalia TaxID=147567 RepID=A0A9P4N4X1_9PLEO|nr:hypothetical protein CC78DRAFT_597171 [Didymosphaeria enalia]
MLLLLLFPSYLLRLAIAFPLASPLPKVSVDNALINITDTLIFDVSIDEFEKARGIGLVGNGSPQTGQYTDSRLDWTSDGCSSSPDHPFRFNFLPSCQRHDFAYRNYYKQGRFNEETREKLDINLYDDLLNECAKDSSGLESFCKGLAVLYFQTVRVFGDGSRDVIRQGRSRGEATADKVAKMAWEFDNGERGAMRVVIYYLHAENQVQRTLTPVQTEREQSDLPGSFTAPLGILVHRSSVSIDPTFLRTILKGLGPVLPTGVSISGPETSP